MSNDRIMEALAEARTHAEKKAGIGGREAREERTQHGGGGRVRPIFFVALLLGLALVIVMNLTGPSLPARIPVETSLRETIYVTVLVVNAEFDETGAYPADLMSVGMDEEGLTYRRTADGYNLVAEGEGTRVEFNSGDDLGPFRAAFEASLPPFGVSR